MTAEQEGIVDSMKEDVQETKGGIEETYEERPGDSAGEKVGGILKQAVQDAQDARDVDDED